MSSYHSSFTYLEKDSQKDFKWIITHFDADNGETESYLSREQVYTESHDGRKRNLYGTKWSAVAEVKITVIKQNGRDFTVDDCRRAYSWLTSRKTASWLDLYADGVHQYSFLGTVSDVKPQKFDARTIGLNIYFESISPWAYSPLITEQCSFGQALSVNSNGLLYKGNEEDQLLDITEKGYLFNGTEGGASVFNIDETGVLYIDNSIKLLIDNGTDDLYTYVYLDSIFTSKTSDRVSIKNITLDEETVITNIAEDEVITISSNQFISSSKQNKIFGNSFNFVWPRLVPGINEFVISGTGIGSVEFSYRYPIKIGDCAIDVYTQGVDVCCPDNTDYGIISWKDIAETPTTLAGYGISDAYTDREIDNKLANIEITGGTCTGDHNVDEQELNDMLAEVLGQ